MIEITATENGWFRICDRSRDAVVRAIAAAADQLGSSMLSVSFLQTFIEDVPLRTTSEPPHKKRVIPTLGPHKRAGNA